MPVSSDFWATVVLLLQSSAGFWSIFLFLFIVVGHSCSIVPRNSEPLYQEFEFAISFTAILLVFLSAGLNLVETHLHQEGSVRV